MGVLQLGHIFGVICLVLKTTFDIDASQQMGRKGLFLETRLNTFLLPPSYPLPTFPPFITQILSQA